MASIRLLFFCNRHGALQVFVIGASVLHSRYRESSLITLARAIDHIQILVIRWNITKEMNHQDIAGELSMNRGKVEMGQSMKDRRWTASFEGGECFFPRIDMKSC
jgi:hypothetical protein